MTPTDYTFTGQFSYITPLRGMDDPSTSGVTEGFGLMFYCEASLWDNARWLRSVSVTKCRGYDPSLGRFAQADTIVPGGVQGLDRYAYVNNAPTRFSDPSGHRPCLTKEECDEMGLTFSGRELDYLFYRLPVDSDDITWTQPFGNTEVAWGLAPTNGYNYCGYAQCLHAGIDLGASAGIPVYAGVDGTVVLICSGNDCNYGPGWVKVMTADGHFILFGHVTPAVGNGATVTPNTIVGHIADQGSNSHVHIEVSKDGDYHNPAVLMEPIVRSQYLSHVNENAFHVTPGNPGLWTNPLNQPLINNGGTPVWVTLGICESKGYGDVTIAGIKYKNRYLGIRC